MNAMQDKILAQLGNIALPAPVMEKTREQFEGGSAQAGAKLRHPEWPALVRLVEAKDPGWKT